MKDTRSIVVENAKRLKRQGYHFRFYSINGEIWECYQAEYLPSIGERAWLAVPIRIYTIHQQKED